MKIIRNTDREKMELLNGAKHVSQYIGTIYSLVLKENLENDENDNNIDYEDIRESSDSEFSSEF